MTVLTMAIDEHFSLPANCPICKGPTPSIFWNRVWGDSKKQRRVLSCASCESFLLWPQRTAEEQKAFDRDYAQYIAGRETSVESKSSVNVDAFVIESVRERAQDIGDWFLTAKSTLEIGAEKGYFLEQLKGKVSELRGCDSCPAYQDILKEKGFSGDLYLNQIPAQLLFDRICFFNLLEHVKDPQEFVSEAASKLTENGKLVIEVPSATEPLVRLYDIDAFKDFYFQDMHPWIFSPKAISLLVEAAGLKVEEVRHKQRYGLANHLTWLRHGRPGGSPELAELFEKEADASYKRQLESSKNSDTIYVLASKQTTATKLR